MNYSGVQYVLAGKASIQNSNFKLLKICDFPSLAHVRNILGN